MPIPLPRLRHHRLWQLAREEIAAVSALAVVALGGFLFAVAADAMREPGGQAFDMAVLQALRPPGHPHDPIGPWWLQEAALDLTSLGGISVLGLFALITVGFLLIQRKYLSGVLLALGLLGGVTLSEGLKAIFNRPRPPADYQAVETLNASFPSGHALLATVFYLSVGVMMARAFQRRQLKAYIMSVAIGLALIVGLTRIYLGAHWLTDVLAGWSIGAVWAMTLWLVALGVEFRQSGRRNGLHDEAIEP